MLKQISDVVRLLVKRDIERDEYSRRLERLKESKSPTYISFSEHTSAMVAFHIPENIAKKLELPNGLSAKEMHITLTYMGDSTKLDNKTEIIEQLELFSGSHGPISGTTHRIGRFNASKSSDDQDVIFALFDSPQLPEFRQDLVNSLSAKGPNNHGFIPHITLAYISQVEETPIDKIEELELTFDKIYLHWGDEVMEFGLDG